MPLSEYSFFVFLFCVCFLLLLLLATGRLHDFDLLESVLGAAACAFYLVRTLLTGFLLHREPMGCGVMGSFLELVMFLC